MKLSAQRLSAALLLLNIPLLLLNLRKEVLDEEPAGHVYLRPREATGFRRGFNDFPGGGNITSLELATSSAVFLTSAELGRLARALGGNANLTQVFTRFVRVPVWLQLASEDDAEEGTMMTRVATTGPQSRGGADVPCLFSERLSRNVFLLAAGTENWERIIASSQQTTSTIAALAAGQKRCPLPVAGQVSPPAEPSQMQQPAVSILITMHNHVSVTLTCLLALLRHADEVESVEYVIVDDGSLEDVDEIRRFLKHMSKAFGLRVKYHRKFIGKCFAPSLSWSYLRRLRCFLDSPTRTACLHGIMMSLNAPPFHICAP